jgi:TolB-like protein/Tfp pilus assembly protein PilF
VIGKTVSHYKIISRLGEGGMGVVYKAEDSKLRRTVALKFLPPGLAADPAARTRFLREARAASALQHHNICTIHHIDETDDGRVFICMECYDGELLKERIARGSLDAAEARHLVAQVAQGLSSAHKRGIVHRDIKPANLVVTADGVVKILDFGLATVSGATRVTRTGTTVGTVAYMSPEQATGRDVDHRSDIWSLGVVLYEMLAGELPFQGDYEQAVVYKIINEDPPPLAGLNRDIPAGMAVVVEKMLEKDPSHRYQDIPGLLADLDSATAEPASPSSPIVTEGRAVAVLPFKMLSGEAEYHFLSLAIAEAVSHGLSFNEDLVVRPTSAVVRYTEGQFDARRVAQELRVSVVVEGSIQKLGPDVRVQIQAWDAVADSTLVSLKLDGHMDDLFGLQDRLSEVLSEAMGVGSDDGSAHVPQTDNPQAYELFLRGSERMLRYSEDSTRGGIDMLRSALELDPNFASAWARLAVGFVNLGVMFDPDARWLVDAEQAVNRALALDADNAEAWSARGRILWSPHHGFQHANALRDLGKACCMPSCPADAHFWRGIVLSHIGLHDEALAITGASLDTQSDDLMARLVHGETLAWKGDAEASLEHLREVLARDPAFPFGRLFLPITLLYLDRLADAESTIKSAKEMLGDDSMLQASEALLWAKRGERQRSNEIVRAALENQQSVSHAHHTYHVLSAALATNGETDQAVRELARAADSGLPNYPAFSQDPHFTAIRKDPGFEKLMASLKTGWQSFRVEFGDPDSV